MKIVFAGTPDLAAYIMEKVHCAGYEIVEAVTNPDRPKGRKKTPTPSDVKAKALELGIPVHTTAGVRSKEEIEHFRNTDPDLIIVTAFGHIIPKEILDIPKYGCINVHTSLLPSYRGAAPIQWAVLNGEKETGVTVMQMDEGLDTGDILAVKRVAIDEKETSGSLFDKMQEEGADLLIRVLEQIEKGTVTRTPQPEESDTEYACMISKSMGLIDWSWDSAKIERWTRGMDPWPCAYTFCKGKMLKIWSGDTADNEDIFSSDDVPGTVRIISKKNVYVKTGSGAFLIDELQAEGKKRMKASDFIRGSSIDGEVLEKRK